MRNIIRSRLGFIALGLPVVALALLVALVLTWGSGQQARAENTSGVNFSLSSTGCDSSSQAAKCTFPAGSQFTVAFNLRSIGSVVGYSGYDVAIAWEGNVNYVLHSLKQQGTDVWPGANGCLFPVGELALSGGTPTPVGTKTVMPNGAINTGCTQGPAATAQSTYTGVLMTMDFDCKASGQGTLTMILGDTTDITDNALAAHNEAGVSEALTINCGAGGPSPTPPQGTPTNTPPSQGTPTNTPSGPTATATRTRTPGPVPPTPTHAAKACGDVNDNGSINPVDALLILQLSAGLITSLTNAPSADVNNNGTINAIDATLILQEAAGLIPASGLRCR